jgi:hypothetical protein
VILGLYRESTLTDFLVSMAAVPANAVARLVTAGRPRTGRAVMPTTDPVMTLPEIRAAAADLLPGATIRRLLFWRYLLVYTEPRETSAG